MGAWSIGVILNEKKEGITKIMCTNVSSLKVSISSLLGIMENQYNMFFKNVIIIKAQTFVIPGWIKM